MPEPGALELLAQPSVGRAVLFEHLAAYLLEQGADPRAKGYKFHRDGRTPLEIALEGGHAEIAQLLRRA